MFEKDAEEIANKRCHEIMCYGHCSFSSPKHHRCGEWHREYECALKGAEFGYNKANEWHFVKDGDLPKTKDKVICKDVLEYPFIACYDDGEWKDEDGGTLTTDIFKWKEIE